MLEYINAWGFIAAAQQKLIREMKGCEIEAAVISVLKSPTLKVLNFSVCPIKRYGNSEGGS